MEIRQLRNATILLSFGEHRLLVDPMLSAPGALPAFKLLGGGRRRNPLVPLPPEADEALAAATALLVTHEHPDHFDGAAARFAKARGLPVFASPIDSASLRRKGLDVRPLRDGALGAAVEVLPTRHGRGVIGWMMGPVSAVYLAPPGEPSVLLTGDAVLDEALLAAVSRLRPEVIVAPAGAANFGLGGDILFSVDELVALARRAPGTVVLNHLEALDHCPTSRADLQKRMAAEGLAARVRVPADGEALTFERAGAAAHAPAGVGDARRPGLQKWLTAKFA